MRKSKCVIFLLLFFVTGCTVNYDYDFDNNTESIELLNNNSSFETNIDKNLQQIIDINSDETSALNYYDFNKIISNSISGISLKYQYNSFLEYKEYSEFLKCYNINKIFSNENEVDIDITINDNCSYKFEQLNLKIKASGKLISTNADKIDKNIYIWNINETPKKINLKVNRNLRASKFISNDLIYIFGFIIVIVIVITIILVNKKNKNNQL